MSLPSRPHCCRRVPLLAAVLCAAAGSLHAGVMPPRPPGREDPAAAAQRPGIPALAEPPAFTLIGPDLSARPVRIAGWSAAGLTVADETGIEREVPRSRAAALAPAPWTRVGEPIEEAPVDPAAATVDRPIAVIELTDGQRFVGDPAMEDAGPDHVAWDHPRLGRLKIPLERVRLLDTGLGRDAAGLPPAPAGDEDQVLLVNGDRVGGLIESIGAAVVVSMGVGRSANRVEIPLDRVRAVTLVNPAAEPSGTYLWIDDGSVVRARSIETRAGSPGLGAATIVEVRPEEDLGTQEAEWGLGELTAVNFDAAAVRPLAAATIAAQGRAPGSVRRRIEPVRVLPPKTDVIPTAAHPLGAADIEFPGPMSVDWTLPRGATRLAGWAELPEAFRAWGDCEVTINLIGPRGSHPREIWRRRINAEAPVARFDVPLDEGTVRITVEPGERGPVQDRIIIRRALLAISR